MRHLVKIIPLVLVIGLGFGSAVRAEGLFDDRLYAGAGLNVVNKYFYTYDPLRDNHNFWAKLYTGPKGLRVRMKLFTRAYPRYYINVWDKEINPYWQPPDDEKTDYLQRLKEHKMAKILAYSPDVNVRPYWEWQRKALKLHKQRNRDAERGILPEQQVTHATRREMERKMRERLFRLIGILPGDAPLHLVRKIEKELVPWHAKLPLRKPR